MNSVIIKNVLNIQDLAIKGLFEFTNPSGSISFRTKLIPEYNYFYRHLDRDIQIFFPKYITDTQLICINNTYYQVSQIPGENVYVPLDNPTRAQLKQLIKTYKTKKLLLSLPNKISNFKSIHAHALSIDNKRLLSISIHNQTEKIEYLNKDNHWVSIPYNDIIHYVDSNHNNCVYIAHNNNCCIRTITRFNSSFWGPRYHIYYYYTTEDRPFSSYQTKEIVNIHQDLYSYPLVSSYNSNIPIKENKNIISEISPQTTIICY